MVDLAVKLRGKGHTHSTHDLQAWAAKASDAQYEKAKIPTKYRPFLKRLSDVSSFLSQITYDWMTAHKTKLVCRFAEHQSTPVATRLCASIVTGGILREHHLS